MASAFRTVLSTVVICTLLLATSRFSAAQAKQAQSADVANPKSGALIFRQDCAVCHGEDAKGHGPASVALNVRPANLTTLAQRHGGKFPDEYFTSVLRNGIAIPEHGPPEMPSWGADFRTGYGLNDAQVTVRILNLKNYIKSRQAK